MSTLEKLKEGLGLDTLDYPVPSYANTFWYSLGGISLFCFIITMITGALLTQFYNPTPPVAHASVRYINMNAGIGFVRALHHWSANLGFLMLIAHMIRILLTGAYRPPRLVTYFVGLGLLGVAFNLYFTGTVLKWDQEGYEAMAHFVAVNKLLGPLGAIFQEDFTLSTSMLARIYGLHIGILPAAFLVLIFLHILYVKHFGIAPKPYQNPEEYEQSLTEGGSFIQHLKGLILYSVGTLIILVSLSALFKPGLLQAPKAGIEVTKPPWLFWIFYPLESSLGIVGILIGSAVVSAGLILIPILGIVIGSEAKLFKITRTLVGIGLAAWVILLTITYFSPVMKHL